MSAFICAHATSSDFYCFVFASVLGKSIAGGCQIEGL